MNIRPQIEDPQGVSDPKAGTILRAVKIIVDSITGRGSGQAQIKTLGNDASFYGVINKLNEVIARLQSVPNPPLVSGSMSGAGTGSSSPIAGSGTVTSVGQTFTGGLVSVAGSPITASGTLALTVAGTSGGIPGFTGTTTWASSVALTANNIVLGGGAGATPTPLGSLGTMTTVLHGNAAGAPTFGAVALATDVSGTLPVANGGTSLTTLTASALYVGNGSSAPTALAVGATNTFLKGNTGANPAFGTATLASADFANQGTATTVLHGNAAGNPSFSAVSLTADVSGLLPINNMNPSAFAFAAAHG